MEGIRIDASTLTSLMTEMLSEGGLFAQVTTSIDELLKKLPELEAKCQEGQATPDEMKQFQLLQGLHLSLKHNIAFDDYIKKIIIIEARPKIAAFIENNDLLSSALPEGYVDKLKSQKATGAVTLLIDDKFKTQELKVCAEKIRTSCPTLPENQLVEILKDVSTVLIQCETESEKLEVANALANSQLLSESPQSYSDLLSAIKKSGSSSFIYYMHQAQLYAQKTKKPVEGLCEKAAYFIGEAIPKLASRYKNLNIVEFTPLIASVISAGQQNELRNVNVVVGDCHEKWELVSKALSSAQQKPQEIESILKALDHSQAAAIKDLEALKNHLQALKNPAMTRVEVATIEEEVKELQDNKTEGLKEYIFSKQVVEVPTSSRGLATLFFKPSSPKIKLVTKFFRTTKTFEEIRDPERLNETLVNQVLSQVQAQKSASVTYAHALTESIDVIDKLIETYPSAKSLLLPLTRNYLEYKGGTSTSSDDHETHIKQAYGNLKNLYKELNDLNDKDMVIGLCEHFNNERKYQFTNLITMFNGGSLEEAGTLLSFAGYPSLDINAKKQFFTVVTSLLNNKKTCNLSDMAQLITAFKENNPEYLDAITEVYKKAPYPELNQFNRWWSGSPGDFDQITDQYKQWSKEPVARENSCQLGEEPVNGFNIQYAKEQYKKMSGIEYTDEELDYIKSKTDAVKVLDTDEILSKIKEIRGNSGAAERHKKEPTELTALMAELLYRTKGMPQEKIGNDRKWGNSFEINTTQYLAVHSLLKSEKPTIAGIGTGEGKSRIMMILLAAQWALGRTVDFVTADVTLATRDYLEYQAYFKSIEAQTNLITAQTPVDQYCLDGINFSDASNLSLFRNKARSQGLGDQVANPNKETRCLLLDEADKTLFDTIDTRYNYSAQADQSIQDMPWIYENLVEFFKEPGNEALFHGPNSDADECNRQFKAFTKNRTSEKDSQKLERISRNQLESWQASAITSLNLKYGKNFTLEADVPIVTKNGPGIVSQARLISDGAASKNAKFSFGVHQCLHARLNIEKSQVVTSGPETGNLLHQELSRREFDDRRFPVDSENQIVYSSTSKALIDDYQVIRGVTGSPGAWTERAEKAHIAFIDIPRHRGVNRIDKPYQLVKDSETPFQKVIADIRTSIVNSQPILLICKDDNESKRLFDDLNKNLTDTEKQKLTRVSADTSIEKAAEHIEHVAGKPGAITVTTARMGRGTDIKLHDDAKAYGMHVLCTYLPTERNYIQIVGRAGRFGAKGSSRFILNEKSIREKFNQSGNLPQAFYTATESYLSHLQNVMDIQSQKQRIIKDAVSDFRMNITNSFFEEFFKPLAGSKKVNNNLVIEKWRKFFDDSDKTWNKTWPKISESLANSYILHYCLIFGVHY
jgi:plasmid stabilization system protein ParE